MEYHKKCVTCGKKFVAITGSAKYCPLCKGKKIYNYNKKHSTKEEKEAAKKNIAKVKKERISYGNFSDDKVFLERLKRSSTSFLEKLSFKLKYTNFQMLKGVKNGLKLTNKQVNEIKGVMSNDTNR